MSTEIEAQTAIEKLHESLAGERKIVVRLARAPEARPTGPVSEGEESEAAGSALVAEPGNEAAPAPSKSQRPHRSQRGGRGRSGRGPRPARSSGTPSRHESSRPAREEAITNSSGYEIYPRTSEGGFATEPIQHQGRSRSSRPESSPYMDDTGDIENRGNRRPPRRRR